MLIYLALKEVSFHAYIEASLYDNSHGNGDELNSEYNQFSSLYRIQTSYLKEYF